MVGGLDLFIFHFIYGIILPIDFHIFFFFKMLKTTNQYMISLFKPIVLQTLQTKMKLSKLAGLATLLWKFGMFDGYKWEANRSVQSTLW